MTDPAPLTREDINELDVQGAWMQRPDAPLLTRLYGQDIARLVAHVRALEADQDVLLGNLSALTATLQDLADHGLRTEMNPTRPFPESTEFWVSYLDRIDLRLRERARLALEPNYD